MVNSIYNETINQLEKILGKQNLLESGNGARFRYNRAYAITVYHADITVGNSVEIAFKPASSSNINRIITATDNQVKPNTRYNWPRVGIKNSNEINTVISSIREVFV